MPFSQSASVRNRLLSMLTADDYNHLVPKLERVSLPAQTPIIRAHQPIEHVHFLESGIVTTVAHTDAGRIEVGIIGREGVVGLPAILGADSAPYTSQVQAEGAALRIATSDLSAALASRPSIFRPLGLFAHTLMIQLAQTAYANATFTIEARLARWVLMTQDRTDGDDLAMTHGFLSAMLGVRRPGVTVATHVLEGVGAIRAVRGRIVVRNRERLIHIAGSAYQVAEAEYARVMTRL
ncbi:Crp/Fnr family transcriptional regulator [Lichenibacterium dinghuense]|uniref:Crp/Fnr family transcriptional regulator n=1 Tax=Lichenibacterium dinghuense TaxID=2895977 RepID=UPI001F44EB77|nr:Crp/Fnr family transcriptional regulator [Lichenibacterium sp. 6Y81]